MRNTTQKTIPKTKPLWSVSASSGLETMSVGGAVAIVGVSGVVEAGLAVLVVGMDFVDVVRGLSFHMLHAETKSRTSVAV